MRILLTGHSGFIASSLQQRYSGVDWVTTDRDINSESFQDLISWRMRYDSVIHCAGLATVSECELDPLTAFGSNAMSVVSVLEGVRRHHNGIPVIVLESDKVYGRQIANSAIESDPLLGWSPYEKSKVVAAQMCDFYRDYYGMSIVSLRLTNTYGPLDRNLSRIIPGTIDRLSRGESPVIWSGSEEHERDYLFIDDLCDVMMKLRTPGAYNVTSGEHYTTTEVVGIIQEVMGTNLPIRYEDKTFSEIPFQMMDGSKLRRELGWSPSTSLREGIEKTLKGGLTFSQK